MDDVFWLYIAYVYIYAVSQFMFVVVGQKHALKLRFPLMYVFGGKMMKQFKVYFFSLAHAKPPGIGKTLPKN